MASFKPMVKMMTTEPTVELKLKKGGHVSMKGKEAHDHKSMPHMMDGGLTPAMSAAMPARGGAMPAARPARPPLAARRRAMAVPPAPMASAPPAAMKKGGKAEGGESKKEHKAEMREMKGIEKELKSHEGKPASKAHKGLKTGGVVMGQGGFKKGGSVPKSGILPVAESERGAKGYEKTKMHEGKKDVVPAETGDIKLNKVAGYKDGGSVMRYAEDNVVGTPAGKTHTSTGAVKLGNAGGYKKGGASKKYARGGAVQDDGKAEKMAQGRKKPSAPVSITALSGTFKKGGQVC